MFNNLIESTINTQETAKKSIYFGITTVTYALLLTGIFVWSIFSVDLAAFGKEDELAVNKLVMPVEVPAKVLPLPENPATKQKSNASDNKQQFDVIKDPVAPIYRVAEPPRAISTVRGSSVAVREGMPFIKGNYNKLAEGVSLTREPKTSGGSTEIGIGRKNVSPEIKEVEAPPAPQLMIPEPKKEVVQSKGVVNGFATSLPKPAYPIPAKAVRASGEVKVQIMIDEEGNVISATAISGHALLRAAAASAAKQAKFKSTLLSNQPVKVTGTIIYNFQP